MLGRHSYNDAINAGYTPAEIAQGVVGKRIGVRAQDMLTHLSLHIRAAIRPAKAMLLLSTGTKFKASMIRFLTSIPELLTTTLRFLGTKSR